MSKTSNTDISAELILASRNAATGDNLYTFRLTYPRFLLSEFNTHRVFSRNTSSSRAIPMKRVRKTVIDDPFLPRYIGAAQKGMQAGAEVRGIRRYLIEKAWQHGRWAAVAVHWTLEKLGAPKQITNRVLEPWLWVTQVVSGTDWKNFIKLRAHKDAEPHFARLAAIINVKIIDAEYVLNKLHGSSVRRFHDYPVPEPTAIKFQFLNPGEWHLPFILESEEFLPLSSKKLISAARAARTSYTLVGSKSNTYSEDYFLGQSLINADPLHASPIEHQAVAKSGGRYGNFRGFEQWRHFFPGESGGDPR